MISVGAVQTLFRNEEVGHNTIKILSYSITLERMRKRKYCKRAVKLKYTEAKSPFHPADVDPCLSMA
jgi:hypothetical protein